MPRRVKTLPPYRANRAHILVESIGLEPMTS